MREDLTTVRKGIIGENRVIEDLLNQDLNVYVPVCDDANVDMLVECHGKLHRVQVKTVLTYKTKSSIEIKLHKYIDKQSVDVIAVYFAPLEKVAYVRYNNENHITLAIHRARNSQNEKRKWFYQYMEFPVS